MKLFTIGDSISQGFMSGGAAKPQYCYNTLLAQAIGDDDYSYLKWDQKHHLKIDLEYIFRELEKKCGSNIWGPEWIKAVAHINKIVDTAEDYFERGDGKLGKAVSEHDHYFRSVAVEGMDVADSWLVTPNLCKKIINKKSNKKARSDNIFGVASDSFYRNAYRVLNPGGSSTEAKYGDYSPLKWLDHHSKTEGVENVILWLGANNALGTVIDMNIRQSLGDGKPMHVGRQERQKEWNLWHPDDFRKEYREMLSRVDESMQKNKAENWNVFVGNVPLVTIAPVARGVGETRAIEEEELNDDGEIQKRTALYYQYYTYFPFKTKDLALHTGKYLKFEQALHIDRIICEFNRIIKEELSEINTHHGQERYHLVDTCKFLKDIAWKRNMGNPVYELPDELKYIYPPINTKYYHCNRGGEIEGGGIFSLDGIHPTPTGQGLIAWEFLKAMKKAGAAPDEAMLDWSQILASDSFRTDPIRLMPELYEHDKLIKVVTDAIKLFR